MAISNQLVNYGVKKIRRLGHTMEFEQIKDYILGDDIRTINWKATAKKNQLMVNQYQDEKSQNVYMMIDKGRVMKMPFEGLSLLDYAINSSLVLSSTVLKKYDKVGMFSFSKTVENFVVAQKRQNQMQLIMEQLYRIKTNFFESDYSRLYNEVTRKISHRSLLILYTNFETLDSMSRQLSYLKAIARKHVLLVVFFENSLVSTIAKKTSENTKEIYNKIVAQKYFNEKKLIVSELNKFGIYTVFTKPENLTLDVLNKYLEIKSRGII